jgi:hypothetical protein
MMSQSPKKGYNGYLLTDAARDQLLETVPPMFADVVAHHVTHEFGVYETLPPDVPSVRVLAVSNNTTVQAVVVSVFDRVGGYLRPSDNSVYHITLSLDKAAGAKAVDSNDMLTGNSKWQLVTPFDLAVVPTFFPFGG